MHRLNSDSIVVICKQYRVPVTTSMLPAFLVGIQIYHVIILGDKYSKGPFSFELVFNYIQDTVLYGVIMSLLPQVNEYLV